RAALALEAHGGVLELDGECRAGAAHELRRARPAYPPSLGRAAAVAVRIDSVITSATFGVCPLNCCSSSSTCICCSHTPGSIVPQPLAAVVLVKLKPRTGLIASISASRSRFGYAFTRRSTALSGFCRVYAQPLAAARVNAASTSACFCSVSSVA